jgi:uncharacterized membrane protein
MVSTKNSLTGEKEAMIDITHVHPMLVHFPIVFLLVAVVALSFIQFRGENLAARNCLASVGTVALLAGTAFAMLAALFGDIALDAAVAKGFPVAPLELHEEFAAITITIFAALSLALLYAVRQKTVMTGAKGWIFLAAAAVGLALLIVTAFLGGHLVHDLGVNVHGVVPGI